MKLEEAVSKIEGINDYRELCCDNLRYWNDRIQYMNDFEGGEKRKLQDGLHLVLLKHHDFYGFVDMLDGWTKLRPPNSKDYGKNAEKWLRAEKGTHYALGAMLGGFGAGISTSIAGFPVVGLPFLIVGGIGGAAIQYFRYKIDTLKWEEDASNYVKDLATYYGRDKYFNSLNMQFFEDSIKSYSDSLKDLIGNFEKHGEYEGVDEVNDLIDNYIELQNFKESFKDVIQTIRKSKKHPVPSWGGGIAPAIISAEASLTIGHLKRNMQNIQKSTSDLIEM